MVRIYVASTSPEKLRAVESVARERFPSKTIDVVSVRDIVSGVPEQPINDDILVGAMNRMEALEKHLTANRDGALTPGCLLVTFESGVWVGNPGGGSPPEDPGLGGSKIGGRPPKDPHGNADGIDSAYGEEGTICVVSRIESLDASGTVTRTNVRMSRSQTRRYPYFIIRQALQDNITDLKAQNKLVSAWFAAQPPTDAPPRERVLATVFADTLAKL